MRVSEITTLVFCGFSGATLLYVTNYSENIVTLELTQTSLKVKATTPGCGDESQYLTPDFDNKRLFCLDENPRKGTIVSYEVKENGTLSRQASVETIAGPVASTLYNDGKGLAVAHFIGAGFTTFDVDSSNGNSITPIDSEVYTMAVEGPNDLRQEHPHPHDAILDPDGRFVLVPDLGMDLIQRYLVMNDGRGGLLRLAPIVMPAASGPRHGVFVKTDDAPTYFYLLSEMGNSITGYLVSYPGYSSIELTQVYYTTIHDTGGWMPDGKDVLGGEIGLSPDGNFLLVTTRTGIIFPDKMNISFTIPNLDPNNKTMMDSDPFVNFKIDHDTGNLTKIQEFPAGGMVPRHFSYSNDGTMVAVVLSRDQRVMIIDRDVKTGMLTKFKAWVHVDKEPSFVLWKQKKLPHISNERILLIAFVALGFASIPAYIYREKFTKLLGLSKKTSYRPLLQNQGDEHGPDAIEMAEGIETAQPQNV
ncbi:hypothetical protein N0V82_007742 [Gnomoniopsis sp. IMI 355080]|nr:hypothetical protein N0V82_007742 [Gnomoniopsis sp. IMI 355080]